MVSKRYCDKCGGETQNCSNVKVTKEPGAHSDIDYMDVCDTDLEPLMDFLATLTKGEPSAVTIDINNANRHYWRAKKAEAIGKAT